MFGILGGKNSRFIGIDFGTSAIKVVELSYKNQKPYLENYGWFDMAGILQTLDVNKERVGSYEEKLKTALHNLLRKMNIKNADVHVAIPGFSGLVVLIEFPDMKEDEIEKAIEFEAHKYIPIAAEDVSISWEIIKEDEVEKESSDNRIHVLLVAAPKKEIEKYSSLFKGTDLNMRSIELETFSIVRTVVGSDNGNYLIMDIGSRATNIILVKNGIVIINRFVDVGGNDITNTIADSLNVSKQRAEMFKKEGKDFLNDKETAIVMPSLELLGSEARRVVAAFREKNKDAKIDRFVISGGSSNLVGIGEYFKNMLGMEAHKTNPWEKISYDSRYSLDIEKVGASFSVALGLALRGIEESISKK